MVIAVNEVGGLNARDLMDIAQVSRMIEDGRTLVVAGDEKLLQELPMGKWIGGTIPYFMSSDGGRTTRDKLFVNELPILDREPTVRSYTPEELPGIFRDAPDHGFTVLILPASSAVHTLYAEHAPEFEDMFLKPVLGWVSGVHLDDLEVLTPKAVNGVDNQLRPDRGVAIHVPLPASRYAHVGIVNPFEPDNEEVIRFPRIGFQVDECTVNGRRIRLTDYLASRSAEFACR